MKRQLKHYMSVTYITFICHLGYPCHTSYFVVALCTGLSMLFVLKLFFTEVKTRQRRQKDMRHFRCTVLRRFIKTFQFSPLPRIMYQKSPKYILRCFLFVYSLRERGGQPFVIRYARRTSVHWGASVLLAWVCCTPLVFSRRLSGSPERAPLRRCCHGALEGQSGPCNRSLGGNRGGHRQGAGPSRYEGGGLRSGRGESEGVWRLVFTRLVVFDAL